MNDEEAVHSSDDLADDSYNNTENQEDQQERTNGTNSSYTVIDNEIASGKQLEVLNDTNDCRTIDNYEGELVMAYDNNVGKYTLHPRTFYALYIGPNDNGKGHLIFKLST